MWVLVGGIFSSSPLFLGTALVFYIGRGDLLVVYFLTFGCFLFSLGSWYHLSDEYSPLGVGCSTPSRVGISSPTDIWVKVYARVLLEWTLGYFYIASVLVVIVDVWCGAVVELSSKVFAWPLKIINRVSSVVVQRPGYCRF